MAAPQIDIIDAAMGRLETLSIRLGDEVASRYHPVTFEKQLDNMAQLVAGLRTIQRNNVFHGDIKLKNCFRDQVRSDLCDFGGAKMLEGERNNIVSLMKRQFRMRKGEDYKRRMSNLVAAILSGKAEQISASAADLPKQLKKLRKWKVLSSGSLEVKDEAKLKELNEYLGTPFLPDVTKRYACESYLQDICNLFWGCRKKEFRRACFAFDQRALGITLIQMATARLCFPEKETDKNWYETQELKMIEKGIPSRAAQIIRKMAEPMPAYDLKPKRRFGIEIKGEYPLPLLENESFELERLLSQASSRNG